MLERPIKRHHCTHVMSPYANYMHYNYEELVVGDANHQDCHIFQKFSCRHNSYIYYTDFFSLLSMFSSIHVCEFIVMSLAQEKFVNSMNYSAKG